MTNARMWLRGALGWSGAALLLVVAIPLIALATLLLRTFFLSVAAVMVLGAGVMYCANGRFHCWAHRLIRGEADGTQRHVAT